MTRVICYDKIRICWQRGLIFYTSVAFLLLVGGYFSLKNSPFKPIPYQMIVDQPMDGNFVRWIAVPTLLILVYLFRAYYTNLEQVRLSIKRQCQYKWIILLMSLGLMFLLSEIRVILGLIWTDQEFILLDILYPSVQQLLILTLFGVLCHLMESLFKHRLLALLISLGLSPLLLIFMFNPVFLIFIEESDPLTWRGLVYLLLKIGFILYPAYQLDQYLMHQQQSIL